MSHTIPSDARKNPMWVFEENYRLLRRLLSDLADGPDEWTLCSDESERELRIRVVERCKYTTVIELHKAFVVDDELLPDLTMRLRIYDDAEVTEVSGYQGCHRLPARYQVGDGVHFKRDEKRQINFLLEDLLRYCLRRRFRDCSVAEIS